MTTRDASTVVDAAQAGVRLDVWLARRFNYHSRARWQELIQRQAIRVNGAAVKAARVLRDGDFVRYAVDNPSEPAVDKELTVLYEDADLLAVSKSGNLPCHPGGAYFRNSLWGLLQERLPEFWIVNRLDRETSGVVLIAKNPRACRSLCAQFVAHVVDKRYLVVVEGSFPDRLTVEGTLAADRFSAIHKKQRLTLDRSADGAYACTTFIKLAEKQGLSVLRAEPTTGRLHQIRASLRAVGFPVVGDKLYGPDENLFLRFIGAGLDADDRALLRLGRQALHAQCIHCRHPVENRMLSILAPVPMDIRRLLSAHGFDLRCLELSDGHWNQSLPASAV